MDTECKQLIKTIKAEAYSIDKKLKAINELISMDSQSASLGICHACFVKNEALMEHSYQAIREFSYTRFSDLINFILEEETADIRYARRKNLDLLYKLRSRDVLRYILENAVLLSDDTQKRWIIVAWLRQSRTMNKLIEALFNMPTPAAKKVVTMLKKMDKGVTLDIIKFMESYFSRRSTSDIILKGLEILQDIASRDITMIFLIKLFSNDAPEVKSKVTLILGKLLDKFAFVKAALQNEDARVRANALESIWGEDNPEAREVFASCLDDEDNRARANAAKGLYEINDGRGLKALMEMVHDEDKMMRASGAWALGEIREVSAISDLQNLQENDQEEIVRRNARIALENMDV